MNRFFAILLLAAISLGCMSDEPKGFPIIADILHTELYDDERFSDIRAAGFNACLCRCKADEDIIRTLQVADRHNLKMIIFSHAIMRHPERTVPAIKDHAAFWQYYLADEPRMARHEELMTIARRITRYDTLAQCYINLLPNTGRDQLRVIGVESYRDYLMAFSNVPQPQISYDFYPVQGKVVRGDKWYPILDDLRDESKRTGRPFWAYVLCVPHAQFPMPTIEHLRLQCYVNLAYGAQGIQFFSYSTPEVTQEYDFHDGPLLRNGKKSKTYDLVKQMNQELKPVASLFWKGRITNIEHRKVTQGEVIISHLVKAGKHYVCFVNKSIAEPAVINLNPRQFDRRVNKNLKEEAVSRRYTIAPGDILILRS